MKRIQDSKNEKKTFDFEKFDVSGEHFVWNYQKVRQFMKEPFVIVTIMRNPIDSFESLFYFRNLGRFYNNSSLKELIEGLNSNKIKDLYVERLKICLHKIGARPGRKKL